MILHLHQTLFQSPLPLAWLKGGAADFEKQSHVLETISGCFPPISSTRGINIEINAISELWVLSFMGFCGLEETERWEVRFTEQLESFVMHSQVAWWFARLHSSHTFVYPCTYTLALLIRSFVPTHINKLMYMYNRLHKNTLYIHTHTHSAESAWPAIFTSWAIALCLYPNIAQMFLAFDVWHFYHLANTYIHVIKTIT